MYPLSLIYLVETQRILTRTSLFLRFTAMVSIGLTDAHVQPVLENNLQLLAASSWF
jgi:hypothetical protein